MDSILDGRNSPDLFSDDTIDDEPVRVINVEKEGSVCETRVRFRDQLKFCCSGKVKDLVQACIECSGFIHNEISDIETRCYQTAGCSFPSLLRFPVDFDQLSLKDEEDQETLFNLLRMALYELEAICGGVEQRGLVISEVRNKEADELRRDISTILVYMTEAVATLCQEMTSESKEILRRIATEIKSALLQIGRMHSVPLNVWAMGRDGHPYFHACLELWYTASKIFLLIQQTWLDNSPSIRMVDYLKNDVDVSCCSAFEQITDLLLTDLIALAATFFNNELLPEDDNWCFPCSCVLKVWLLLKRFWDTVVKGASGTGFWACVNSTIRRYLIREETALREKYSDRFVIPCELRRGLDTTSFFWRLVRCLSCLYQNTDFKPSSKTEVASIIDLLSSTTLVPLLGNSTDRNATEFSHTVQTESQLRSLLSQYLTLFHAFDVDPSPLVPLELWSYFQKRLGFTFCSKEISDLFLVYESASEWLEKLNRLAKPIHPDGSPDRRNSFELFMAIVVTHCRKGDSGSRLYTQLKGRILSKLTARRFQEFSECALFNCLRLLLIMAQFLELDIIVDYVLDFFAEIPLLGAKGGVSKQKIVWQSLSASILLHQEKHSPDTILIRICEYLASSWKCVYQAYARNKNDIVVRRDLWELLSHSFKLLLELSRGIMTKAHVCSLLPLWTMDFYQIFSDAKEYGDVRGQHRLDFLSAVAEIVERLSGVSDSQWKQVENAERSLWCAVVKEKLVRAVRFHLHNWPWSEELADAWYRLMVARTDFRLSPVALYNEFINVSTPNFESKVLCYLLVKLIDKSEILNSSAENDRTSTLESTGQITKAWLRCVFASPVSEPNVLYVTKHLSKLSPWRELFEGQVSQLQITNYDHCQLFKEMCLTLEFRAFTHAAEIPALAALCEKTFSTPVRKLSKLLASAEPPDGFFHCSRLLSYLVEHCAPLLYKRGTNESLLRGIIASTVCNYGAENTPPLVKKRRTEMATECLLPILRGLLKCDWNQDDVLKKQILECYRIDLLRTAHERRSTIMDTSSIVVALKDSFTGNYSVNSPLAPLRRAILKDVKIFSTSQFPRDKAVARVVLAFLNSLVELTRSVALLSSEAEDICGLCLLLWLTHGDQRTLVSDCADVVELCHKKVETTYSLGSLLVACFSRVAMEYWRVSGWNRILGLAAQVVKRYPEAKGDLVACVEKVTNDVKTSTGSGDDMRLTALRPLRRDLDQTRKSKPLIRFDFTAASDRHDHQSELEDFHELLRLQKESFRDVQKQYLMHEWSNEADQKAADTQAEQDAELLANVDKVLAEVSSAIRKLSNKKSNDQQRAPAPITPTAKLPKVVFPTFDGNVEHWQSFWDRYKASIHDNASLTAIDKMSYLAGLLTDGAQKAIAGLAISSANYPIAIKMLEERFGNIEVIIDAHYTALTDLPPAQNQKALRAVVDKMEQHLNSLRALGEDTNHRQFTTLIKSKLPPSVIIQLEKEREDDEEEWNVDTLREHIRKHLKICETAYQKSNEKLGQSSAAAAPHSPSSHAGKQGKSSYRSTTNALFAPSQKRLNHAQAGNSGYNRQPQTHQYPMQPTKECPYCGHKGHFADECRTVTNSAARKEILKSKKLCLNCLGPGHQLPQCRRSKPCRTCKKVKSHHSSICLDRPTESAKDSAIFAPESTTESAAAIFPPRNEHAMLASDEVALLQTVTAPFISHDGKKILTRGVFDNGSQRSYITEQLAQKLGLKTHTKSTLSVFTFGSSPPKQVETTVAEVQVLLQGGTVFKYFANVVPVITGKIARVFANPERFDVVFKYLPLADLPPREAETISIQFLFGSDYMWDLLTMERMPLSEGICLIGSKFGWLLCGRQTRGHRPAASTAMIATTTLVSAELLHNAFTSDSESQFEKVDEPLKQSLDLTKLWDLESIGITDPLTDPTDETALKNFNDTICYNDNRYYVTWPWREQDAFLPSNFQLSLGRLNSLLRKYKSQPEVFHEYHKVIQGQEDRSIIEKVEDAAPNDNLTHYIPHHAVLTPHRTTKIRIIYDGSAKTSQDNKSLNECLLRGPVMLDDIVAILLRFRLNKVAIASDIEKAFLQVGLQEPDRDVTRFLWLKNPELLTTDQNLQIYRFTRVPFGIVSSPFLLAATIDHHLRKDGGDIAMQILRDIYVDNIITGTSSDDAALEFYRKTKDLFSYASMNVREWMSNSAAVLNSIPATDRALGTFKILGIPWNPVTDAFNFVRLPPFDSPTVTKRAILQYLASIYDPMGLVSPSILPGKIFLQQLWLEKLDWDTELSPEQKSKWANIALEFALLDRLTVPRFIGPNNPLGATYELHAFCDASQDAYGVCIYLRVITGDGIKTNLLFGKTRLAPTRLSITIPRLELLAVYIGCKCLQFVSASLPVVTQRLVIWTDSQCVLHWLKSDKTMTVFVRNRVNFIKQHSNYKFRYVPTLDNPADLASRGLPLSSLIDKPIWWYGPSWLQEQPPNKWPQMGPQQVPSQAAEPQAALEEITVSTICAAPEDPSEGIGAIINCSRYSSFTQLLRVTARCLRVTNQFRGRTKPTSAQLTADELHQAKILWLKYIQLKHFSDVIASIQGGKRHPLVGELALWIDAHGLLRCGGRLQNANLSDLAMHPILIPKKDHFTTLVIRHFHFQVFHAGTSHTLSRIRNEYWIPAGRSSVYQYIRSCAPCKKFDGGAYRAPPMPSLPTERVAPLAAFTATGLDYLGPLYVKEEGPAKRDMKVWICLFTCLSTRAVHLELLPDMSATQFLLCLRRFIARRGVPSTIISDNATQFKPVKSHMEKLWSNAIAHEQISSYISASGIAWKFITERAPWMGGFYERLVRPIKQSLRKSLGKTCLTFIQLHTLTVEIEAVVNSRPLTYVGSDFTSGYALTPAHFLAPNPKTGIPALDADLLHDPNYIAKLSTEEKLLDHWKAIEAHLATFWRIWYNDYLLSLRERPQIPLKQSIRKAPFTPQVGHIVQIQTEKTRGTWPLAQIFQLIRSADGNVRTAVVRTAAGKTLNRSITHLYPLECSRPAEDTTKVLDEIAVESQEPPQATPIQSPVPKRNAARLASERIKAIAHYEDAESSQLLSSESTTADSTKLPSTRQTSTQARRSPFDSTRYLAIALALIAFSCLPPSQALQPLICEAKSAKIAFNISNKPACVFAEHNTSTRVVHAQVLIYKRNLARYDTMAYRCSKVQTVIEAWTNFAKLGFDKRAKEKMVPVDTQECYRMITTKRCREGPLHGGEEMAHTDNKIDPPYSTGNAWDCCRWIPRETTNCFLVKGKAYATFGDHFESNLGNVAHCEYERGSCILHDQSVIQWNVNDTAKCEFIAWHQVTGKLYNGHFLSDSLDIALTWSEGAKQIRLCDGTIATMTDQGLPVIYGGIGPPNDAPRPRLKRAFSGEAALLATQLQALEERLEFSLRESFRNLFYAVCRRMEELQSIDMVLAHAVPTLLARKLLNDSNIMARLSGTILEVWPCVAVDMFETLAMDERCTEWIPVNFTLSDKDGTGFLEPQTQIIYAHSAPADCALVQEIHLQDVDGQVSVYYANRGVIERFKGSLISHPLHTGNMVLYSDFHTLIHRPIEMWAPHEIKAQTSLNDIYYSVEQHESILRSLANTEDQPMNSEAQAIVEAIQRYTPMGWIGQMGSKLQWFWIYCCCTIVTIAAIGRMMPGVVKKQWDGYIAQPGSRVFRYAIRKFQRERDGEGQPQRHTMEPRHGPVEQTIALHERTMENVQIADG